METELRKFIDASPTPFHAAENLAEIVEGAGFQRLSEKDDWLLTPGQGYYLMRSGSSFVAFIVGNDNESGLRVLGAHTDSPCLKLKSQPEKLSCGYQQFGVEVYGGVLLAPWFDRDLSIAGKVTWQDKNRQLQNALVNFCRPLAVIPSLAIHLNREANSGVAINPELHMNPVWCQTDARIDFRGFLKKHLRAQNQPVDEILDFNLSFYDCQQAAIIGENQEFIAAARLDNLLSCFVCTTAIANSAKEQGAIVICNDHEEVGSRSNIGAQGSMLSDVLERIEPDSLKRQKMLRHSVMLSVDNAHGVHPNFPAKHQNKNGPVLNGGPVIKFDAKQSYATNSESAALVRLLAAGEGAQKLPLQEYTTRADMACGSTIGPLTAARTGIPAVDLGVATFAMHSIRELAGVRDVHILHTLLQRFLDTSISMP